MNNSYKVIWNEAQQSWVVVGELTRGKGKSKCSMAKKISASLSKGVSALLLSAGLSLVALPAFAVNWDNAGTTGDWLTVGNWNSGVVPTSGDDVTINNLGTANVTTGNAVAKNVVVGQSNDGHLVINGGFSLTGMEGNIANNGGTSTATVDGIGSSWINSASFRVGRTGMGTLNITNGGLVSNGAGSIGAFSGAVGLATVDNSTWNNSGSLSVGLGGAGTLNLTNGGVVSSTTSFIGRSAGSIGTATINGAGSGWTNSGSLFVGDQGTGTLNIENGGAVSNAGGTIGAKAGATGTVTVDGVGSSWTNNNTLSVGDFGTGTLAIRNAGTVSSAGNTTLGVRLNATGTATIDGAGSNWTNSGSFTVGNGGIGNLSVTNGGVISNTEGHIGRSASGTGTATINGVGSSWTNSGSLFIGEGGTGTLNIENGGVVSNSTGTIGDGAGSSGTATVDGAGSSWTSNGDLNVGDEGTGNLNITNSGVVNSVGGGIGSVAGSTGTVTVDGVGSSWTNSNSLSVGDAGTGTLSIENGGVVSSGGTESFIGRSVGSMGTATINGAGSTWTNSGGLIVGDAGTGTLNITNGGVVTSIGGGLGRIAGNVGTVTVDGAGSSWVNSDTLFVGGFGTGNLNITNGGAVSNATSNIGKSVDSSGTVTVDGAGSSWTNSSFLTVGSSGRGTLNITNGGVVNSVAAIIGSSTGSEGSVVIGGTGSTWTIGGGTGTLDLSASGQGQLWIGSSIGSPSVAAPGTLDAANIAFGANGTLSFNHNSNNHAFTPDISSGGGIINLFSGTTRFTNNLTTSNNPFQTTGGNLQIHSGSSNSGTLELVAGQTLYTGALIQHDTSSFNVLPGTLQVNVTDDTTYGKLVVTGQATLPTNAKIDVNVADPSFAFTSNTLAGVLSAGSLNWDGSSVVTDNSVLFDFTAIKNGNALDLVLGAPGGGGTGGATTTAVINTGTPAALGAATVIDDAIANDPTGALATSFVSLTTEQEVANAVESTLPGVSGGVAQITNIATNAVTGVVAARQDLTRGLSSGDGFMTDRHLWFKPFGGWTDQDNRQGVTGYDIDSYGLAAGFDGDISSTWNVGLALAYINSDVDSNLTAGSHTIDIDSYQAKVYATKMIDDVTALNLQVGAGISDYDSTRRIFTGDVADADYDSWNVQLSAELERSYQVSDKTVVTPYVHADYGYVKVEDYNETGAGALNLNVDDDSSDSLIIGAGIKGNHAVAESLLLMANAGVGYDVMTDRTGLTSSFAGGGAQFATEGIEPDEWVYNAGVGAKYNLDNGTEITANYNIDARQDYTDQSVSVNFRLMF